MSITREVAEHARATQPEAVVIRVGEPPSSTAKAWLITLVLLTELALAAAFLIVEFQPFADAVGGCGGG